jgi:hypothetical protein
MSETPKRRLRLVGVTVHHHLVLDEVETLSGVTCPPVEVASKDWPTYSTEGSVKQVADWQRELDQS